MAYRNIFVANQSVLKLKNNQLIVDNGEEYSFPIEDVRSVILDNCSTTVTCSLLSELAGQGVCVMVCDSKHMPACMLLPVGSYCRISKRITLQINQSSPKLKRIWQRIVVSKIENQARCLEINNNHLYLQLINISKTVASGDSTNREGYAARVYFKALFGDDFTRDDESIINAGLNYGYAILRSYICKTLVAYGFEPSLGIHHKNQLNQFNLADDLIEPFRPVVDNYVFQNIEKWDGEFKTAQKGALQLLLNSAVLLDGKRHSVANAIELVVQGIVSAYEEDIQKLKLPQLTDTEFFNYD